MDKNIEKNRRQKHRRHPLLQEIKVLKKIHDPHPHPHIVRLINSFETKEKDISCIVLEFLSGMNLFDRMTDIGKFSETNAREIFLQLYFAISYLHSLNIVHRDLKPE